VSQNSKIRLLHVKQIDVTGPSFYFLKPTDNFTYHQVEHSKILRCDTLSLRVLYGSQSKQ